MSLPGRLLPDAGERSMAPLSQLRSVGQRAPNVRKIRVADVGEKQVIGRNRPQTVSQGSNVKRPLCRGSGHLAQRPLRADPARNGRTTSRHQRPLSEARTRAISF